MIAQYIAIGVIPAASGGGAAIPPIARRTALIVGVGSRIASFTPRSS